MNSLRFFALLFILLLSYSLTAQEVVPIIGYDTDVNGQVELTINSTEGHYYLLQVRHATSESFTQYTSMTIGKEGTTIISEPLEALPLDHYQVIEVALNSPTDIDLDGINDMVEFLDLPKKSPLNTAPQIGTLDGVVAVDDLITFKQLSVDDQDIFWAEFLSDQEFVKFITVDLMTDKPQIYFINSNTHYIHEEFITAIGLNFFQNDILTGEIIYHPTVVSNNGTIGTFSFNYSFGYGEPFPVVQATHEIMAKNMPFLKNNLSYYITDLNESDYTWNQQTFDNSRVSVLFEDDIYEDIDYLALNIAEGFGFFRLMDLDETPGSKDVVLYETLPNTLPRVGGIMTSFIQTPLSHVNLRAIQDKLPNAFIRDPIAVDSIFDLIGKYVYYRVDQDKYFIREASIDEVNDWFEDIRPSEEQIPALDLSHTSILPLDNIAFDMSDAFGAKCANVATMRNFGFPEGTIPDGFGVPFYFYQEFMEYNGFFDQIDDIIANPDFQNDLEVRIEMLDEFRSDIRDGDMPQWMLDELQEMHDSFPEGTSVRCRSSTNNEDLPGFSGAGLYTSKTQHPSEGHISKSIKQVYAGMWNFRAYDERDFYRVDQHIASMGVLCHPNYSDEKANGVGVSTDPIYQTDNTFYINTQVGEDLVTNPDPFTIPEEILLDALSVTIDDYVVIRFSSLQPENELLMTESYRDQMRYYLGIIHNEFQKLYNAEGSETFAMDIEYKITAEDQLIIKQARPWASFWSEEEPTANQEELIFENVSIYPNPVDDILNIEYNGPVSTLYVFDLLGNRVRSKYIQTTDKTLQISLEALASGSYIIVGLKEDGMLVFARKVLKTGSK